jgi:hypothetical protein
MRRYRTLVAVAAIALFGSTAALATHPRSHCSIEKIAGRWAFATDQGRHPLLGVGITALGVITIHRDGRISGQFDVNVENAQSQRSVPFEGTLTVDADCRATGSMMNPDGTTRTDSVVILNRYEM